MRQRRRYPGKKLQTETVKNVNKQKKCNIMKTQQRNRINK